MTVNHANLVVIGGGQAGARTAHAARAAGFRGSISIVGSETHAPYERPYLSKDALLDATAAVPLVAKAEAYESNDISLRLGITATRLDPFARAVELNNGDTLRYDKLVLATGSHPRLLTIEGMALGQVLVLRTIDDGLRLAQAIKPGRSVAIIGGGFIGLEVAAAAVKLGARATVIEAGERLLPRMGSEEASAMVLAHHRAEGIDIRLGTVVVRGTQALFDLSDGTQIEADVIVGGIGIVPASELAEAAGLRCEDGIVTDEFGATSDPDIFAAGDVTRHYNPSLGRHVRLESWQNANSQADAVGRTLAGHATAHDEVPWLWSDQGALNIQVAGAPVHADRVVTRRDPEGDGATFLQFAQGRLIGGITLNSARDMPVIRRMLALGEPLFDADLLADHTVPLRRFLPKRETA